MPSLSRRRHCAEPGCPELVESGRCPRHARSQFTRNHRGVPRQARGHGAEYQRARRELLADHPRCHWCGAPATTADYAAPWSRGGTLASLVPACGRCNYGRGARLPPAQITVTDSHGHEVPARPVARFSLVISGEKR